MMAVTYDRMLKTSQTAKFNEPTVFCRGNPQEPIGPKRELALAVIGKLQCQARQVTRLCDTFRAHVLGQQPLLSRAFLAHQAAYTKLLRDLSLTCSDMDLIEAPSLHLAASVQSILPPLYRPDLDQYLAASLTFNGLRPMTVTRLQNTALAVAQRAIKHAHPSLAQPSLAQVEDDLRHCARLKQALSHPALHSALDPLMETLHNTWQQLRAAEPVPSPPSKEPMADGPDGLPSPGHFIAPKILCAPLAALDVPARWAFVASGTPVCGKVKGPSALYQGLDVGGDCPSTLYDDQGRGITMLSAAHRGSFGKVRFGVTEDQDLVAIKQMYHAPRRATPPRGARALHVVSKQHALLEFQWTQQARDAIEHAMAPLDALQEHCPGSLKRIRTGVQPYVGYTFIDDAASGKSYSVMTKEAGDLSALAAKLDEPQRLAAALSLAAQGYSELAVLHDLVGLAHLDLSMQNVLFSGCGQMKLLDFGASCCVDTHGVTHRRGFTGATVVPEALKKAGATQPLWLTVAADVFALAVIVFETAAGKDVANPFSYTQHMPEFSRSSIEHNFAAVFRIFSAWKKTVIDVRTQRISANAIIVAKKDIFRDLFAPLAQGNKALCELLINDAMDLDPQARSQAASLAEAARDLLPYQDPAMAKLLATMNALAQSDRDREIRRKVARYSERERTLRAHLTEDDLRALREIQA